jgi:hypothetical protein
MRPQGGIAQSTQADSIVKQLFIVPEFSVGRLVGHGRCLTSHRKRHYSWSFSGLSLPTGAPILSHKKGVFHEKSQFSIFLIITWVLVLPASAEIYKYVDENGQKRWTDDLSQVPKEQRPSAQRFESVEETQPGPASSQTNEDQPETTLDIGEVDTDSPMTADTVSRDALEKEKADLDTRYRQLMEERKQLEQLKSNADSSDARSGLNKKISAYNEKTEQYETQLNDFNEKIKAYNESITTKKTSQTE